MNTDNNGLGSWSVRGHNGAILRNFERQNQAIEFANKLQRQHNCILSIDPRRAVIQIIGDIELNERAG